MRLPLSFKIVALLATTIALATFPLGFTLYTLEGGRIVEGARNIATTDASRFALTLTKPLWNLDVPQLKELTQLYMSQRETVGTFVYDEADNLLVGFVKDSDTGSPFPTRRTDSPRLRERSVFSITNHVWNEGRRLGRIDTYLSTRPLQGEMSELMQRVVGTLVIFFAIAVTATFLGVRLFFIRPVTRLHRAIASFWSRDRVTALAEVPPDDPQAIRRVDELLSVTMPRLAHDEVGSLGEAFTRMVANLRESFIQRERLLVALHERNRTLSKEIADHEKAKIALTRLNEELEARVARRTAELRESNRVLGESLESLQRTQTRLIATEKMAALGSLVAGIAHEINTPVGVSVTAASLLEQQARGLEQLYAEGRLKRSDLETGLKALTESSAMVLANLTRTAEIVGSFKRIAVDQSSEEKRPFNLRRYIDEVMLSLHPRLKKTGHKMEIDCPDDLELESYPGAFSQILTNLTMNALAHAFDDRTDWGTIGLHVARDAEGMRMVFVDDGKGIPQEHLPRIFDPFFTTKRGQGGSGLGLHIVYNLVTQSLNGHIECESEPEKGTRFIIRIPWSEKVHPNVAAAS